MIITLSWIICRIFIVAYIARVVIKERARIKSESENADDKIVSDVVAKIKDGGK